MKINFQNFFDPPSSVDANFIRTDAESWFDPNNWQDDDGQVTVETERVPCRYDSVVFPRERLFNVELQHDVTIGGMNFAGKVSFGRVAVI